MVRDRRTLDGGLEQILPDGSTRPLVGNADWARVAAMTEDQIEQNARDDPDNPPLTPERLATMRRGPNPKQLRLTLGLPQKDFARQFGIPLETLREWEMAIRHPDRTAKTYLRVIESNPYAVRQALGTDALQPPERAGATPEPAQQRAS